MIGTMKMTKGVHPFAHDVEIIYPDNTFLLVYVTKSLGIFSPNGTSCIIVYIHLLLRVFYILPANHRQLSISIEYIILTRPHFVLLC